MAFLKPDSEFTVNGLTVKQYFINEHNPNKISMPSKMTKPLIGITLHNTDDIKEASGTTDAEQYTRSTVNGNMGTVRVHYYVDDKVAWQNLPHDWQSWHAGQRGKGDAHGSAAGNAQTISIECIEVNEKAEDNAARLIAWLLDSNNMTIEDNLYTHNYWCNLRNGKKGSIDELNRLDDGYKNCPVYIRPHWDKFLNMVRKYMKNTKTETKTETTVKNTDKQDTTAQSTTAETTKDVVQYAVSPKENIISIYSYKNHKDKYVSTHFQVKEFADFENKKSDKVYSNEVKIHNRLVYLLERLFAELNCKYIIVNSGYRTTLHEKIVGNLNGDSYHTKGRAADITCYDKNGNVIDAKLVCITLEKLGAYGIGYINNRSVHVDTRSKTLKWFGDESEGVNILKSGYDHFIDYFAEKFGGV